MRTFENQVHTAIIKSSLRDARWTNALTDSPNDKIHLGGLLKIEIAKIMIQWAWGKAEKAAFLMGSARDANTCSLDQRLGRTRLSNHKEQNKQMKYIMNFKTKQHLWIESKYYISLHK